MNIPAIKLHQLVEINACSTWDETCDWAEGNIQALADFMQTWGRHCGAPRTVFRGHLVKMLLAAVEE